MVDRCELARGTNVIKCKWVYKLKYENGIPVRWKVRLTACGNFQVKGVDYEETFASVCRMTTVKAVVAIAVERGYDISHLDVDTAFLYGKCDKTIYMEPPPGYEQMYAGKVLKLVQAIYGLVQLGLCIWGFYPS